MSKTCCYFVHTKEGRVFCVEPIDNVVGKQKLWGDIDPASKTLNGNYGNKYPGSIHESDSIITKENGFKNIGFTQPGVSPDVYINSLLKSK